MKNFRLLSTKELNPVQKRRFIDWGCLLTTYNFIRIETVPYKYTALHKNLIFTSQNGVKSFFEHHSMNTQLLQKKLFCVGEKTKALLEKKGFTKVLMEESANALAKLIVDQHNAVSGFSFICGKNRRPEIESVLRKNNIPLDCVETYTTYNQPKSFGTQDGILFFSPSGVESYLQKNVIGNAQCFAIGQTTASVLTPHSHKIHVAKKPTFEHIGLCVHKYLNSN